MVHRLGSARLRPRPARPCKPAISQPACWYLEHGPWPPGTWYRVHGARYMVHGTMVPWCTAHGANSNTSRTQAILNKTVCTYREYLGVSFLAVGKIIPQGLVPGPMSRIRISKNQMQHKPYLVSSTWYLDPGPWDQAHATRNLVPHRREPGTRHLSNLVPDATYLWTFYVLDTWYQVPGPMYLVPAAGVEYRVPSTMYPIPRRGARCQVPGTKFAATRIQVPDVRCGVPCTRYLLPGTKVLVHSTLSQVLVPGTGPAACCIYHSEPWELRTQLQLPGT